MGEIDCAPNALKEAKKILFLSPLIGDLVFFNFQSRVGIAHPTLTTLKTCLDLAPCRGLGAQYLLILNQIISKNAKI